MEDVLLVRTNPDKLATIQQEPGIALRPLHKYEKDFLESQENENNKIDLFSQMVQTVVAPRSDLIGRTIGQVDFLQNHGVIIVGVLRRRGWLRTELSHVKLHEGDILVMVGSNSSFKKISEDQSFLMLVPFTGRAEATIQSASRRD